MQRGTNAIVGGIAGDLNASSVRRARRTAGMRGKSRIWRLIFFWWSCHLSRAFREERMRGGSAMVFRQRLGGQSALALLVS